MPDQILTSLARISLALSEPIQVIKADTAQDTRLEKPKKKFEDQDPESTVNREKRKSELKREIRDWTNAYSFTSIAPALLIVLSIIFPEIYFVFLPALIIGAIIVTCEYAVVLGAKRELDLIEKQQVTI